MPEMPSRTRRKTFDKLYYELAPKSLCATTIVGEYLNPSLVHIRLAGPIANIPSLKNQKIKGTNILRDEAKVILTLMTAAFFKSVSNMPLMFSPKVEIAVVALLAYRKVAFDEDNVLTSIRDWLEPRFIRKRDREWGIGIIPNDRVVNSFAVKKRKTAPDAHITDIFLRPLNSVRSARDRFLSEVTGVDITTACGVLNDAK